jgi:hypothetical protein
MADKPVNLRGAPIKFRFEGKTYSGVVVTRTRGTRWLVQYQDGRDFDRVVLDRSDFEVVAGPTAIRRARSPIEAMIDKACGL